jgi:hypothetical protein
MQYASLASYYFSEAWKMPRLLRGSLSSWNIVLKKKGPGIQGQVREKGRRSGQICQFWCAKPEVWVCPADAMSKMREIPYQ